MSNIERTYLPPAGRDWALPLYDPLVKFLGIDTARRRLLDQAALQSAQRILDIGCGTGTLAILTKHLYPSVDVVGLDPDPKALARARRKAEGAGVSVEFDQSSADTLPYPGASFDRVFSSFMFHHLHADQREKTLREVRRVLTPGGSFHLLDFGGPADHADNWLGHLLHSSHRLRDNSEGRILTLMGQAGFPDSKKITDGAVLLGCLRIAYYRASVST